MLRIFPIIRVEVLGNDVSHAKVEMHRDESGKVEDTFYYWYLEMMSDVECDF